jgi:hypothetical protein
MNDVYSLLSFVTRNPSLFPELNKKALNCAHEVLTDRNAIAHQEAVDVARLIDTASILLRDVAPSVAVEVERLRTESSPAGDSVIAAECPEVIVVACTAAKRRARSRAEDLYDPSPLFRLCRACARQEGKPWLIISSKYGFVEPHVELDPYEEDPRKWSDAKREEWIGRLSKKAQRLVADHRIQRVSMLAGQLYRAAIGEAFSSEKVRCAGHPDWGAIHNEAFADRGSARAPWD